MTKNCFSFSFIVFTFCGLLYAQEAVPFKVQTEFYIYGDATVIGNNILSKDVKEPFNDTSLTNDDIDMVFVDIDKDPSTFSSSSASLKLPKNKNKIVYAALYWTATYSYEQGYRTESAGQFLFQGKRVHKRDNIHNIKFKTPNNDYKNIKGSVIFDGFKDNNYALNSPYVCFADVTKLLKNNKTINGEYTVANVKATKGFVSGGSAAGWLLYVVYETPTKKPKYITNYNGFAHISNKSLKLKFNNFKPVEKGDVKTALTFAALEGDSALTEDECILVNPMAKKASVLRTKLRPSRNFFNSKITYADGFYNERFPKSENTLGFDIASLDLSSESESIIDNTTTEVEMVFNTESDRFYMFFAAFQTEISKSFYEEKNKNKAAKVSIIDEEKSILQTNDKPLKLLKSDKLLKNTKQVIVESNKPKKMTSNSLSDNSFDSKKQVYKPEEELSIVESYEPQRSAVDRELPIWLQKKQHEKPVSNFKSDVYQPIVSLEKPIVLSNSLVMNRENYEKLLTKEDYVYETQKFKRILNQETTRISGVKKGYYVIAGLLYDLDFAVKYQEELHEQGVNSKLFKDVSQGKFYVYLYNSENFYDVFMLRKAFVKSEFLEQVWILNINIEKKVLKKL